MIDYNNVEHKILSEKNELKTIQKEIILKPDIDFIENTNRATLIEQNTINLLSNENANNLHDMKDFDDIEKNQEKGNIHAIIKEETGWSDDLINCVKNKEQYDILKNANLKEQEINGKKCLIKENIELKYTDADGISNADRINRGLSPLDNKTGKPLELHHLGQKVDSPLVELTDEEHRTGEYENGKKNQSLWHDNTLPTEIHNQGNTWSQERKEYWKTRSVQISRSSN